MLLRKTLEKIIKMKSPKTTSEHIIALYGYITGLRRDVNSIKNNHLKHMHKDIDELHNKVDRLLYWILGGLGATIATLVGLIK